MDFTLAEPATPTIAPTIEPDQDVKPDLSEGDGDHDRFAHYVRKADATRAYIEGTPVVALCGKVWVPSRDPEKFPVCPTCVEIREALLKGAGGSGSQN